MMNKFVMQKLVNYSNSLKRKKVSEPTNAKININGGSVSMSINGVPSIIEIEYSGIVNLRKALPPYFKIDATKDKIIIVN